MTVRAALGASALALAATVAACSGGGGGGGGATVIGRVQDEAGTGIEDASVALDSEVTQTAVTGSFRFSAARGWRTLDVTAAGYRRVTTEIKLASGDNSVEVTMVTCTPGIDAGCGTPTPTPTASPTPTPPNVVATFVGVNANVDPVPANSVFGAWTGSAVLTRPVGTLNLGNDADASDLAFSECWLDMAETDDWDGAGTPDHCIFWWEGEDEGAIVSALNDAVFYVRIPGAEFIAGNVVTFADGMTAGYYEGDFTVDGFRIADYGAPARAASEGTLTLGNVGMGDGQNVSITGQATFYIPNLP